MKQKGYIWSAGLVILLCIAFSVLTLAESPSWWTTRGVINTNWPVNDYAPVLAGQLKWMATNAVAELETLPGGAGTGVHALVGGFTLSNNYVPINLGQLKNTAAPFYQRLMAVGYTTNYPWTETTADDADFAPAVLGQLKYAFAFDVSADSDDDQMPDWWEVLWFGGVTNWTGSGDGDVDELSNLLEYQNMTSPTNSDTDTDGIPDGWEVGYSLDPLADDSAGDPDGDGLSNLGEYNAGTDPLNGGDPGFMRPVSFRVTTSSPKLYICEVDMTTNTDVCGHLNDMTLCTQQEAVEGRESCDDTYEGDSYYGNDADTYTTFFRGGADNVRLILDSACRNDGCCKSYSGTLKLYRATIVDWEEFATKSDAGTYCNVSRISSNEISWSVYLDGYNCGNYGSGGCYLLQVNWRRPTNDLSMMPWIDILPTNHIFVCAGCSNPVTLTARPYGVTSANYTWSITPSGGAYFSGPTTGLLVNVMAGNNPGDYIVQCRPASNMNLCVLGSATVTVLKVESLLPDSIEREVDDGDGDDDTRTFVVNMTTNSGDIVTVTATVNPGIPESSLPSCWTLDVTEGTANGSGKLTRTIDRTQPSKTVLRCSCCGGNEKVTTVYVVHCTYSGFSDGAVPGHAWWTLGIEPASAVAGVVGRISPPFTWMVNADGGFFPIHEGQLHDDGWVRVPGGAGGHTATANHDWTISFQSLVSGLTDLSAWKLAPGTYDWDTRNCVYGALRIGADCLVSMPSFSYPGFFTPTQFANWLSAQP